MRRFIVDLLPWKNLHDVRDIIDTIHNTSLEIFESKKRALLDGDEAVERQVGQGKDILSILSTLILFPLRDPLTDSMVVRANMNASEEDKLDESEVVAQVACVSHIFAPNFIASDPSPSHKRFDICCSRHDIKRNISHAASTSAAPTRSREVTP